MFQPPPGAPLPGPSVPPLYLFCSDLPAWRSPSKPALTLVQWQLLGSPSPSANSPTVPREAPSPREADVLGEPPRVSVVLTVLFRSAKKSSMSHSSVPSSSFPFLVALEAPPRMHFAVRLLSKEASVVTHGHWRSFILMECDQFYGAGGGHLPRDSLWC